nr:hypothetical protein [Pseudoramibacter sp. HA2172]
MNDTNNLSPLKWNGKYHVMFALKHRRMVFYREKKRAIGEDNKKKIREYISHRLETNRLEEQLTIPGTNPFRNKR